MKGLLFDNRLLVRELNKIVMRNNNQLSCEFSIEPVAGVILEKETLNESFVMDYAISKVDNPELWLKLKDANNEEMITFLSIAIKEWLAVYQIPAEQNEDKTDWSDAYKLKINVESFYWNLKPLFKLAEKYSYDIIEI